MDSTAKKRITMKLKHANPLFEQWLTEWRDSAIETDSKMQHCYGKALQSLKKYPLPLQSGRDCKILQGFGEKLCCMLDKKLTEHKQKNPEIASSSTTVQDFVISKVQQTKVVKQRQSTNKRKSCDATLSSSIKQHEYVPTWRSGACAIMITLYEKSLEPGYAGYMFKADITKNGQHLCDKSFVKPDAGSYYTAWSSMKTLLDKNLVTKQKSPAQFSLTDNGLVLAHKLYKNNLNDNDDSTRDLICNNEKKSKYKTAKSSESVTKNNSNENLDNSLPLSNKDQFEEIQIDTETDAACLSNISEETFIFTSHSFKIILLVDKQETVGGTRHPLDDATLAELQHLDVTYEVRHLKVGDYGWVCRQNSSDKELILPYIVERKRMDDFGCSIKDGRFHEQKFRLKQCGLQNLVYLIESYGSNTHTGLPITTLYQAATNTLLQDNFSVKFTDNLRETIQYLASFTSILTNIYEPKTLVSCPKQNLASSKLEDDLIPLMTFQEFNKGASKSRNFKVQELFVRQLLQLKGVSVEKALAIVEKYPTPRSLRTVYKANSSSVGEKLLSSLQYGKLGKKIGPVTSKTIYQLYSSITF